MIAIQPNTLSTKASFCPFEMENERGELNPFFILSTVTKRVDSLLLVEYMNLGFNCWSVF